jgi:hypothetical protein
MKGCGEAGQRPALGLFVFGFAIGDMNEFLGEHGTDAGTAFRRNCARFSKQGLLYRDGDVLLHADAFSLHVKYVRSKTGNSTGRPDNKVIFSIRKTNPI